MEIEDKRRLSELIELYNLHPELRDVYVEGINDKLVFERFFEKNGISDYKIIEIDDINFSELYDEFPEIKRNNKNKIIALSEQLSENFSEPLEKICCIADKDYDEFLDKILSNEYLLYTDFTCLEMYLFNIDCIRILYRNLLKGFPIAPSKSLKELGKVLKKIFLIRLAIKIRGEIKDKKTITDLKKSAKPNKETGEINFDYKKHLVKILTNNRLGFRLDDYVKCIEIERDKFCNDHRNHIRGHDFIHLLFIYIDKIQNNISLTEETLENCIYQYLDFSKLNYNNLFKTLQEKYK